MMLTEEETPKETGLVEETGEMADVEEAIDRIDETIDIISVKGSCLPHVMIELEGIPVCFVVDTGCEMSSITREQMTSLGFEESDLVNTNGTFHLVVSVKINNYKFVELFYVLSNFEDNLLGLNILANYCCIIDLDKDTLTFRELYMDASWDLRKTTVNIQGKDVEMDIDTGAESYMTGTLSLAKELNLPLKAIQGYSIIGVGYEVAVPYVAPDLCIKAFGREVHDAWYKVKPDETPEGYKDPTLGVPFFYGLRLLFNPDGSFEVMEPETEDVMRSSDELSEEREISTRGDTSGSKTIPSAIAMDKPQGSDKEATMTATEDPKESDEETTVVDMDKPQTCDEKPATKAAEKHQESNKEPTATAAEVPQGI
ncbi:uncharacterized protein LOC125044501 [Penaeus chinensis]|uniref:uncharacterized protein LOC125044501 n=1 Tax=Penaeus chinensis TaxID=139456 RepID=UPI001FB746DC|nr:uncharacterized protein LOC125044501 [Penaeus chinensis]